MSDSHQPEIKIALLLTGLNRVPLHCEIEINMHEFVYGVVNIDFDIKSLVDTRWKFHNSNKLTLTPRELLEYN